MAMLFECPAEVFASGTPHPVKLQISLHATDNKLIDVNLVDEANPANSSTTSFKLTAPAPSVDYYHLHETVTLEIDLSNDPVAAARFKDGGAAGICFKTDATLATVKIVLRPRPEGEDWSSQTPCFAIIVCWTVKASAAGDVHTTAGTVIAAETEAAVEVCAGFSAIFPNMADFGLPAFQVRLDLPTFGLTSNWVPLAWFEVGDLSPFRFNGLAKWFGDLAGFTFPGFPSFPLPTWNVDLPFRVDLPLGIGARQTELHLSRLPSGNLVVSALAKDFYLAWKDGSEVDLGGRIELTFVDGPPPHYTFEATLFETQYPKASETVPYSFSLPFDVLTLTGECWYLRMGLFASSVSLPVKACFEFLLEIGGFTISSSLAGGVKGSNLYRSDVRLLMRDFRIMTNAMQGVPGAPAFLAGATSAQSDPFEKYQMTPIEIPALSFARDLLAPTPPASSPTNDYGMEFLDGDFRAGERVFILWRQNGLRFLRALAHDLLGRKPAGAVGADEIDTLFGLEIAQFDDAAKQLRLDWRPITASPAPATAGSEAPAPIVTGDGCLKVDTSKPLAVNLPLASSGVFLDVPPADAIQFNLPAIAIEVARPKDQSIIIRRESDGRKSVSHLLLYEPRSSAGAVPVEPLARARIGFSLKDKEDPAEAREVVETNQDNAFLTVAVGFAGGGAKALRTVGWTTDQSPRFLQTLRAEAEPVRPLLPPTVPAITLGDPGCPGTPAAPPLPAPLNFDAFETPDFSDSAWRLSLKIAAATSLFKAFDSPDPNQRVRFSIEEICQSGDNAHAALIRTNLSFRLGTGADAFEAAGKVTFRFDIRDLALTVEDGAALAFKLPPFLPRGEIPGWAREAPLPRKSSDYWYSQDKSLFGFQMSALAVKQAETEPPPEQIDVLVLSIKDGRFMMALPEGRHVVLRYDNLGRDSLNFWVTRFVMGPGGLDLDADLLSTGLRVKGLSRPFLLEKAGLRIRSSKLDYLSVDGSGRLPELLNEAPINLKIAFEQREKGEKVELAEMHCELGDKDKPIFSRGTKFKFEIEKLGIQYVGDGPGDRHFFFEVTGSAQFTPDGGEFDGGLLEDLKSARIEFVRAPLSDEFHKSLKLVVELKRPVVFDVFKLFRMEIRSIGFDPKFDGFAEPGPAVIIGGQCEFAKFGDVISGDVSFHAGRIGFPKRGDPLPQVHFDGLRVDISSSEGFRIAGRVDRYDTSTLKGFAGEGTVQIPGFPELSAAFAFVRLREQEIDPWRHGWFIAIEVAKISYQIGSLPIYLRQIGLGFGYRYTLPLVKKFEGEQSLGQLIKTMLAELDKHQTLARIDSWTPDPDRRGKSALWTIALEAVFSMATANPKPLEYRASSEQQLKTLVAQILAAFRSDFTLMAAAKIWYPVSVDDFFRDLEGMRRRPLASGFMIYSAPQSRFLAHAAKGQDPYMGPTDQPVPEVVKDILRQSHFEGTLLIEPGLIHAELGWPDRLMFSWKIGSLELQCRGGVLLRLERDILIQGTFFSARGSMNLGGGIDLGFIGVRVEAFVQVQFATRLLTAVYLSKPMDSKIYAALGLDIAVRFSISAWLKLKIGFVKIRISISFSRDLQITVALELGWAGQSELGFRGRAQLTIGVFGRSLGVSIAVGLNSDGVEKARLALQPYMGSLIEPGQAPPMPGFENVRLGAVTAPFSEAAPSLADIANAPEFGKQDEFVTSHAEGATNAAGETLWFVWIMPGPSERGFYPPTRDHTNTPAVDYATLDLSKVEDSDTTIYSWTGGAWAAVNSEATAMLRPHVPVKLDTEGGDEVTGDPFTLQKLLAGCWLVDATNEVREGLYFPEYWPGNPEPAIDLPPPKEARSTMRDARVFEIGNPARSPNRRLDQNHPYDAALQLAAAATQALDGRSEANPAARLEAQARGNQSFLLQAFYDDLVKLAETSVFDGSNSPLSALPSGRPTLLDTGMVLCVKAKQKPTWISKYDKSGTYPTLKFKQAPYETKTFTLRPVIDFDMVDFAKNPPVFVDATTYFDEEVIGLAFDLDWGGRKPLFAEGANEDVESYVRAYQIEFYDFETQSLIRAATTIPAKVDLTSNPVTNLTDPTNPIYDALRTRYQYTVMRNEVAPEESAAALRERRIMVRVTPISQTGQYGAPFTDVLRLEPTLTPLPADDAHLTMSLPESGDALQAVLEWRQLALPSVAGVAPTEGWHLVLRPLRGVPLGAYPDDAVDVTDRGLMSATGQALIEGDIVIKLYRDEAEANAVGLTWKRPKPGLDDHPERDPAELIFTLDLTKKNKLPGSVYDHRGRKQSDSSPLVKAAKTFFEHTSAANRDGSAWRLFLRATANYDSDETLARGAAVSGLAPVRLLLKVGGKQSGSPPLRPLSHFEWPVRTTYPQVDGADIAASAGPIRVAVVPHAAGGSVSVLSFVQKPGRSRAVTVRWNAIPSGAGTSRPLEAVAAYDVFELPLDMMVNADLDPDSGFKPDWRWLRRIAPTDADQASQIPASMADVQNWEAQYPSFARTVDYLTRASVDAREMPARWSGWYSWDESELKWPPRTPFTDVIALPQSLQPLGTFAHESPTPAEKLAIWRELGHAITKGALHDYLTCLIGHIADQGGIGAEAKFEVQIIASQPTAVTDPLKWLMANTATLDPYGWAALNRLGLGVTVALRDPVTGLLQPQRALREQYAAAVKGIAETADAVGGSVAADVEALRAHLLVELPIQHLRAYRADGDSANLDNIALSLLQVSLRPIPSPTATYRVMTIVALPTTPAGDDDDADITPKNSRVDLLFPKMERSGIAVDPSKGDRLSVRGAFSVGDVVLVREFARSPTNPAEFDDVLKNAGVQWKADPAYAYGERPLPLLPAGDVDPVLTPFQKFGSDPDDWKQRLIASATNFGAFVEYLVDAFKSSPTETSSPVPDLRAELTRPEAEELLRETYMVWSARFFVTAPLGWVAQPDDPLRDPADYMAVAQPKSADPLKIAADGRGRLLFTRFVEEEWANERSYAVMPVGRYERLWAVAQPPATAGRSATGDQSDEVPIRFPDLDQGRAEVDLPRIRRLEAPKLLLARLLRSQDGRTFNELILSHTERTLSQTNVAARGKITFGEIRRKYLRQFIHQDWDDRLRGVSLLAEPQVGLPQPLARTGPPTGTPHDLDATVETLLAKAPQARWDSTRYVDAAEPFYYRQSLHFEATASVDVVSDERTVILPTPEPDEIRPIGDPPVALSPIDWSVISAAKQTTYDDWLAKIGSPSPIADRLRPQGFRLSIRLPRLIESLSPESLANHFAYETKRYQLDGVDYAPVGFLPDPDVRIVILDQSTTITIPIAQIVPKTTGAASTIADVLEFKALSSDFIVPAPSYTVATDWADGIMTTLSMRPNPAGHAVQLAISSVPALTLPDVLGDVDPTQLLAPEQLPKAGPLLQLTPLALRLELETVSTDRVLTQVNPLTGERWLGRPHLTPSEEEAKRPLTQDDLTIGVRLIMDLERRRAAALLGWDIAASAGSAQRHAMAVGLLQRVEESDIAILLERAKIFDVSDDKLEKWAAAGIVAWHREPSTDPLAAASWTRITTLQTANTDWNLITIKFVVAADPADQPVIDATVDEAISTLNAFLLEDGRKLDKSKVVALNRGLERLAGLTFRTMPSDEPIVVAQRGNAERVDWPKAM